MLSDALFLSNLRTAMFSDALFLSNLRTKMFSYVLFLPNLRTTMFSYVLFLPNLRTTMFSYVLFLSNFTLSHRFIHSLCDLLISRSGLFSIQYPTRFLFSKQYETMLSLFGSSIYHFTDVIYHVYVYLQNNSDMRISLTKYSALIWNTYHNAILFKQKFI
jgi:uncharacterized membrane protein YpjA